MEIQLGLLDRFEQQVDKTVNGAFAKAFKSEVQPVELAAAIQHNMDDRAAIVSRGRTVVPNSFVVELSQEDFDRLTVYAEPLQAELAGLARDYAEQQQYSFLGPVTVHFQLDDQLTTGISHVVSEAKAAVSSKSGHVASDSEPRLVAAGGEYPLASGTTRIGRGADADIRIDDSGVSRHHVDIVVGRGVTIRDLGSTNGTYVDGKRITELALRDGATIKVGSTTLTFRSGR
ncbi:MAG: DUF3662 and FHA domain-containing protein [Candidatus Nanopelagicales bacterium]